MKKKLIWMLPAIFFILLIQDSCELFGDSEHCQYEATDTKLWLPDRDPALGFVTNSGNPFLEFGFARVIPLFDRSLKIENVCPFGALKVAVSLTEKNFPNPIPSYECDVFTGQERIPIHLKNFYIIRDYEIGIVGSGIVTLNDLIDSGPKTFYIRVVAYFDKGDFANNLAMEQWAKDNIAKVTIAMAYVKWE
jgi:hypothetical protein